MEEWNCIGIYDDAVSIEICQALIDIFERFDREGETRHGVQGYDKIHDPSVKDSQDLTIFYGKKGMAPVERAEGQMIMGLIHILWGYMLKYFNKVDHMLEQPSWVDSAHSCLYPDEFHLKRYMPPGQGYHAWHPDNGPANLDRLLVALLYLNDVEEGGETMFYHQNLVCKPKAGRLIIFPAGFTHIHKGNRPVSNTKYILNGWFNVGEHWLPPAGTETVE